MLRVCTLREQEVVLFDLEVARDKVIAARTRHDREPLRVVRHRAITCAGQGAGVAQPTATARRVRRVQDKQAAFRWRRQ
jgi:hypothetical protein